ncbi:MAG: 2-phospho-L-lactate transferase [Bryobacteraceae bacterium]|nr:2-phospho-L-lactate transferase [Bryobacteraceae bacterium]
MKPVVALAGGVGAARFLDGLARVMGDPERLYVVGNTGDDAVIHGLHISPDLDTVMYMLGGVADPERGWGVRGDTFHCLEALGRLGAETWFQLGDRDLATHLRRTEGLRKGLTLAQVTAEITASLGVRPALVPMSNERVRTIVQTPAGELEFQRYFVARRARDRVLGVRFDGAKRAKPSPGVLDAVAEAEAIVVCPSNPFISIDPILAIPGVRRALRRRRDRVAAVSPIVGGHAIKGPAARMMKSQGIRPAAVEVARRYADFVGVFILDEVDRRQCAAVGQLGIRPAVTNTIMRGEPERIALARTVMGELGLTP